MKKSHIIPLSNPIERGELFIIPTNLFEAYHRLYPWYKFEERNYTVRLAIFIGNNCNQATMKCFDKRKKNKWNCQEKRFTTAVFLFTQVFVYHMPTHSEKKITYLSSGHWKPTDKWKQNRIILPSSHVKVADSSFSTSEWVVLALSSRCTSKVSAS